MKLRRIDKSSYLLVRVDATDRDFLKGIKMQHPRVVKTTDKYLSQMLSINLKSVFVMDTANILLEKGEISQKKVDSAIDEMENALNAYEKAIDKYFEKFADLEYGKVKRTKKKRRKKK